VRTICLSDQAVLKPILRGKNRYSRETRKRFSTTYGHQAWLFSEQSMPLRRMRCAVVVQDFEGVAVQDRDDGAGEVGSTDNRWDEQGCQQQE
jgi:hypothetical protein